MLLTVDVTKTHNKDTILILPPPPYPLLLTDSVNLQLRLAEMEYVLSRCGRFRVVVNTVQIGRCTRCRPKDIFTMGVVRVKTRRGMCWQMCHNAQLVSARLLWLPAIR